MTNKGSAFGHIAAFIAYAIFGFNIIVCKDLTSGGLIPPLGIFTLRSLVAGGLFWLVSLFMPKETIDKKDYIKIFAASMLGFLTCQVTFLVGIPHITPMDCSILTAMAPIYTMAVAAVAIKEPITFKKSLGVAISFAGIIYLIVSRVATPGGTAESTPFGIFMIVLNSLSFSMYLGIFKPLIAKYSAVTFMKWIFLFSAVVATPLSLKGLINVDWAGIPSKQYAELAYLIVCATFITYFLIPLAQKRIRPTLISMYSYVQPIIAIAVSIAIGMDTLTWQKSLATILVFAGLIIVSRSRAAK
ncbi:MAG: EamA family transporter [Bacteroidales bacterium]|nr:EamA family transporter [Bacteroidales bacterium]MBR5833330.1 EamA family transporter [Bacteroidales bacterium]